MERQSFVTSVGSEVKVLENTNNQVAVSHLFVAASFKLPDVSVSDLFLLGFLKDAVK